ncbi:MAG: DUF1501 domain-containing protein [Myxococcaceae bacterium]
MSSSLSFDRRFFLKSTGLAFLGLGFAPGFLRRAVAQTTGGRHTLVLVFLRGGADGLSFVPPVGDAAYYAARPTLALARPGADGGALKLDGTFGLHPALSALYPLWQDNALAVVQAAGLQGATRSHFDAQDFCETGTPGCKTTADGWLNRSLQQLPEPQAGAFRAVALQGTLPRSLQGAAPAVAVEALSSFHLQGKGGLDSFEALYAGAVDEALRTTGQEAFEALRATASAELAKSLPENGAVYGKTPLARRLQDTARLVRAGVGLEVVATEMGGWDTHVGEGNATGQLATRLREFADALAAFARDLGPRLANVTVVVMTEFGRTVRENGNRGTDHGTASVMLALGGSVRGGRVYGHWGGLEGPGLFENRDLAITVDVRSVLSEALQATLKPPDLATVFPGFSGRRVGLFG